MAIQVRAPDFSGNLRPSSTARNEFQIESEDGIFTPANWKQLFNDAKYSISSRIVKASPVSARAFGRDKQHCLCVVLKPLLVLARLFGIFPVIYNPSTCKMTHKWISWPAVFNLFWLFLISTLSLLLYYRVLGFFSSYLDNGTDFYTFSLVFLADVLASVSIFICGNFNAEEFTKGWSKFHAVVEELALPDFLRVKRAVYIIPLYLFHEFLANLVLINASSFNTALVEENDDIFVFIIPFSAFMTNFVPNFLCGIFVVLLWIVGKSFSAISSRVEEVLRDQGFNRNKETDSAERLGRLRLQHEELGEVVRHLEKAFGFQMLAVFVSSSVSFVAGIYGGIIATQGLSSGKIPHLTGAFSLTSIFAGMRILFVICFSQVLMNEANSPSNLLNLFEARYGPFPDKMQVQVDRFLHKLGNFPLKITCCDVFTLGSCFLASAASNVVTYVLVLMQFRLEKYDSQNCTTANNGSDSLCVN